MYVRQESEYYRAKMKAARRICHGWVKPADLPTNREIRDEIQSLARIHEGDRRTDNLRAMRFEALRVMRLLRAFRPRLIGSTLTGHVRHGSDIDLHVFADNIEGIAGALEAEGCPTTSSASGSASTAKSGSSRTSTSPTAFQSNSRSTPATWPTTSSKARSPARPSSGPASPSWNNCSTSEYPDIELDEALIEAERAGRPVSDLSDAAGAAGKR